MSQKPARPAVGRSGIACRRCHNLKVKCDGGRPCKKCYSKNHECTYPIRDRNLTISEGYLNGLQSELNELRQQVNLSRLNALPLSCQEHGPDPAGHVWNSTPSDGEVDDPTPEVFVSKLRELVSPHLQSVSSGSMSGMASPIVSSPPKTKMPDSSQSYSYVFLSSDNSSSRMSLKLPSFPQAKFFLDTFDLIMGSDYHWFQHDTFRKQVEMLYHDPSGPYARDRIWLCRLLTTLAIGQTYVQDAPLVISFDGPQLDTGKLAVSESSSGTNVRRSTTPPGTDLFEQALNLLHISYEEPRIEHIEVLNLIVSGKFICEISSLRTIGNPLIGSSLLGQSFYCYSLNRRKTAFVYAGMTMRLSNMIGLDKPAGPEFSAVEREHRKRLWWTSYCFDKNTSSEMGWKPAYVLPDHQLGYPSNDGLSEGELLEFHDPGFLTAQVKLTELKLSITETAYRLKAGGSVGTHEIRQCLNVLQNWMSELAPNVAINLTFGIPSELAKVRTVRTSASLVLKYDHCIILLLRPFLLREIANSLGGNMKNIPQEDQRYFGNTCIEAARNILRILNDLLKYGQLAKFGFWESLHLFSSLSILALARLSSKRWPAILGLDLLNDDEEIYAAGRDILCDMSNVGNFASKDHLRMLLEIENLEKIVPGLPQDTTAPISEFFDVAGWQNMFFDSDLGANDPNMLWNTGNML